MSILNSIRLPYLLAPNLTHLSAQSWMILVEIKRPRCETNKDGVHCAPEHAQKQNIAQHKAKHRANHKCRYDGLVKGGEVIPIRLFDNNSKRAGAATNNQARHQQDILNQPVPDHVKPFASLKQLQGSLTGIVEAITVFKVKWNPNALDFSPGLRTATTQAKYKTYTFRYMYTTSDCRI
jgi:hypothetical protein